MTARLGVSVMAQYLGWRPSFAVLGVAALLSAVAFWRVSPVPRGFVARNHGARAILASAGRLLADRALLLLFGVGGIVMGAFVTLYNYTSFRLLAPPYFMSHTAVGAIFLLYILGSASSTLFGSISGRFSRRHVFWMPAVLLLVGIMLTAAHPLVLIIGGIAIATIGIFGIHSIAASWVSHRAGADRSLASALYLFCYYMGGSLLGPVGGLAWGAMQWPGVVLFTGALGLLILVAALLLIRISPLPHNLQRPEDEPQLPPG
ncbi:MAG: MFS transporter [Sphingomonas sp.]|nr:MFS transporter [Sphingomonas sp.]